MAQRAQFPRPVVRCAAGLHANSQCRKLGKEGKHLIAPQLLAQHRLFSFIHAMQLENAL
jgi:hypothetical protein